MQITDLRVAPDWVPMMARWHFDLWGPLTGADSVDQYAGLLRAAIDSNSLPCVLIAQDAGRVVGSVNVVACDCRVRPDLTPWLGQLFVEPESRRSGIGAALVRRAVERARTLGFSALYLFTSGTLPDYYIRLGWSSMGTLLYLGKQRTLMVYPLSGPPSSSSA